MVRQTGSTNQEGRKGSNRFTVGAIFAAIFLLALAAFLPSGAGAQTAYGTIVGTVSDSTGAVVQGVNIVLVNTGTSEQHAVKSDERGNYQFVNLLPGAYKVTFERQGFKKLLRENVEVKTSTVSRIDAALQVGAVDVEVEVTSAAPQIDTQSSTVGAVVEGKVVQETPLNGRNVMNLIALEPGVVPQGSASGSVQSNQHGGTFSNPAGWGNYQIGGGMAGQSAMWLDGQPLNGTQQNSPVIVPSQDIIQEFRVETNTVSPEFGRFAGGVVSMTSKQGSNKWGGSAYEYLRNRDFNANDFFSKQANQPRGQWTQNQYGVTVGGPVKKDKAFFFFAWEGFRLRLGDPNTNIQLPTSAEMGGDFSAVSAPINDPLGGTFSGNKIPSTRWDSAGAYIINHYYTPKAGVGTTTPAAGGAFNLWSGNGGSGSDYDQLTGRADINLNSKQRLFVRFTNWTADTIAEDPFQNGYGKPGEKHQTHQAVIGDTYTINEKTIADVRISYSGMHWDSMAPSQGKDLSVYGGVWSSLASQVTWKQNLDAALPAGGPIWGLFMDVSQESYDNILGAIGNLTRIQGRNTIKVGGEWRYNNNSNIAANNASGQFLFVPGSPYTGNMWADLLLGTPIGGGLATVRETGSQMYYAGLYAMDTFQLNQKLTLNFGIRWEQPGAFRDHHDLNTVFLPGVQDTTAVVNGSTVSEPGLLALVNSTNYGSRYDQQLKWNLIVPRVGFAYRATDKLVVKGGFGMSMLPSNSQGSNSPITGASNSINPGNVFPAIFGSPSHTWLQNAYGGTLAQPTGRAANYRTASYGTSISVQIPYYTAPYASQWNLTLGEEFGKGLSLEAGYVGSKGTHLPNNGNSNINQIPESAISTYKGACNGLQSACTLLTPQGSLTPAAQLLFPFPQYVGVNQNRQYWGSSIYHGLEARLQEHFKQGSYAQVAWTWSKMISDVDSLYGFVEEATVASGPQDEYNHRAERSISSFDEPQRIQISYFLALPFGKGQHFANNLNGVAERIVGGWGINGITTFQKGFPLALQAAATTLSSDFNAGTPRPNITAGCALAISGSAKSKLNKWFNTACLTQPGNFSFGNAPRNTSSLRADGVDNWDLSLVKKTKIFEAQNLEFRAEAFNIANHARFMAPNTSLSSPQFGQVTSTANKPRLLQLALRYNF